MSDSPPTVLFVCTANICRSAYAVLRARAAQDAVVGSSAARPLVTFASAGTHARAGSAIDPEMATILTAAGIEVPAYASTLLDRTVANEAALILTAAAQHRQFVLEEHPQVYNRTFTLGQFAQTVSGVRDLSIPLTESVALTRPGRVPSVTGNDIDDPYGQGTAAVEAAARQIDGYLSTVLAWLGIPNDLPEPLLDSETRRAEPPRRWWQRRRG